MERKKKRLRLAALLLAAALALGLTGCESLKDNVANMLGFSSAEEVDTTNWAEATTDPIMLPDGHRRHRPVDQRGGQRHPVRGVQRHLDPNTGYFQVSGDSLTITACGTAEGVQEYKIALWIKGGRRGPVCGRLHRLHPHRRPPTTGSPSAGWTRRPSTALTISYDSSRYYLYGMFKAEGIVG